MRNRTEYPENWYDEIRPQVLSRDKYKCVVCQIKNRQWVAISKDKKRFSIDSDEITDFKQSGYKVYRIYLHVCHRDNNKQNISLSNLITLCVGCHAKMDGNYKGLIRKGHRIKNQLNIYDIIPSTVPMPAPAPLKSLTLSVPPSAGIIVYKVAPVSGLRPPAFSLTTALPCLPLPQTSQEPIGKVS